MLHWGTFTVPTTGHYAVSAVINYSVPLAFAVTAATNPPYFSVRINGTSDAISGTVSVIDLTPTSIPEIGLFVTGSGVVTLVGELALIAGQVVDLSFNFNGIGSGTVEVGYNNVTPGCVVDAFTLLSISFLGS